MKITWFGHSCFMLESSHGTLLFDPFENNYVKGYKNLPEGISADEVICSHDHKDHSASHLVKLTGKKHSYDIVKIPTFHDEKEGSLRGKNNISLVSFDGIKLVHMGDLGCPLNDTQKEMLMDADIVMIPVGGYYTIDAAKAFETVKSIRAKVTVPMHYRGDDFGFDEISHINEYLKLVEDALILDTNVWETDKKNLNSSSTVVFMPPR